MSTTMAPVDLEIRQEGKNSRGERDGGRNSHSNSNSRNRDDDDNDDDDDGNNRLFGGGNNRHDSISPIYLSPQVPTFVSIPHTAFTTQTSVPTITLAASTAEDPSTSIAAWPTSSTFASPSTPTSVGLTSIYPSTDTSSKPMKGVYTDYDKYWGPTQTPTASYSTTVAALAETAATSLPTSSLDISSQTYTTKYKHNDLSPTIEHLLIALGAIGTFITLLACFYVVARIKKIDIFAKFRDHELHKGGSRGWCIWRRKKTDYEMDAPPKYPGYEEFYGYPSEQKHVPARRQLDEYLPPRAMPPPLATPETAEGLSRGDFQRQDTTHEALPNNPAPWGVSPSKPTGQSATRSFYNQNPEHDQNSSYNQNLINNTNVTGVTRTSRQTLQHYDLVQRDINHLSCLSSLSSGFGDAQIIIPESGPTKPQARASQQSYRQSRKFSWATSARQEYRDTVYTRASVDSTPRFRTVNSWVAQQTGRIQRQQQSNDEVPNMPSLPKPLQIGPGRQTRESEDPAFRQHPGDEIEISRGRRIPSTILDKKTGVN